MPSTSIIKLRSNIKAGVLVAGRLIAHLVHISYQLFQPSTFDSIIIRPRAGEMPGGKSALKPGRHAMVHGNGTSEPAAEFPVARVFTSIVAGNLDGRRRCWHTRNRRSSFSRRLPTRHECGTFSLRTRAMPGQRLVDDEQHSVRAPACLCRCSITLRRSGVRSARIVLEGPGCTPAASRREARIWRMRSPRASSERC
jgi:hypothetical protein